MELSNYKLVEEDHGYTLVVYLDPQLTEFSSELGQNQKKVKDLQLQIRELIKRKFPHIPIKAAKVMVGSIMLTTLYLGGTVTPASAQTIADQTEQVPATDVYTVKSGDSLSVIGKKFNVSVNDLKEVNGLETNTIFVGQQLKLPYVTYTVVSGDSLSVIAKRFNTTHDKISSYNGLTSNTIYVGQQLKIPQSTVQESPVSDPEPTKETETNRDSFSYTVVSGDSLSLIAKKHDTTVTAIKESNNLTSDMIYVGQTLILPQQQQDQQVPEQPSPSPIPTEPQEEQTTTTYTVVSGDSLSVIAKRFDVTVNAIKSANHLTTDMIFVGQKLEIPADVNQQIDTEAPSAPVIDSISSITAANQSSVVVSGSTEGNATVTITLADVDGETKTYEIKADGNGDYQRLVDLSGFNDGAITITANAKDEAGNQSTSNQLTVNKDTVSTAPTLTSTSSINQHNALAFPVTGTAEPASTVEIVVSDGVNSDVTKQTIANEQGEYTSYLDLSQLDEGEIFISVRAVDRSGNVSEVTDSVITKDTMISQPTIDALSVINSDNVRDFLISGTSDARSSVQITVSDGINPEINTEITSGEAGNYHADLDLTNLNDGTIKITTTAKDSFGNKSETNQTTVVKDTHTAEPVIDNKEEVTNQNADAYTIFGLAEPGSIVDIRISDGETEVRAESNTNENGEFRTTVDLRTLNEGPLTIVARSIDQYGNYSPQHPTTITKETSIAAPVMETAEAINNQSVTDYTIVGNAQPGSTIDIVISDGVNEDVHMSSVTNENGEFHVTMDASSLKDTDLTVTATQTSKAGVTSEESVITVVKDTSAPLVPIFHNNHVINQDNQSNYRLSGTGEEHALISIKVLGGNGQDIEISDRVDENGEYSIPVDLTDMNDGDITFEVTQTDQVGNDSPIMKKTLVKDTVGPTSVQFDQSPSIFSGNAESYILTGKAEPNITLELLLTDGVRNITESVTTDENGDFDLTLDVSRLSDGEIEVLTVATDAAGNSSELDPKTITKDTTAPTEVNLDAPAYVNSDNSREYTITGTSDEEDATVAITVSDGETEITKTEQVINGAFSANFDLSIFEDGRLSLEIRQTDKAGNIGIVDASTIEKDTVVEEPSISKNGFSFENQNHIYTVIGRSEANATINIILYDSENNQVATQTTTADDKGYYEIDVDVPGEVASAFVTQTDKAGNTSEVASVSLSMYIVAEGDSLEVIAKRYNTTVDAIMSLNNLPSSVIQPDQSLRLPVNASEVINLGYMYFGNTKEYVNTVNQTGHSVNIVSPSYFDINPDGTLKLTYQVDPSFVEAMHQQGIRVVPFLSNHWDREVGRAMLANKEQAAVQIADAIERYQLDGVNVDIENVSEADRDNYTEFVRLLRELIPDHKEVSVAVAANPNGWTAGWHGSYDYTELAKYSDYLMIMSYDESYPGGEAGPVASAEWVERSIQYAIDQGVPNEKIVIGIAHYGRYWIEGSSYGGYGISNSQVEKMIETYDGTVEFDEVSKSPKATVTIEAGDPIMIVGGTNLTPGTYTIWFENEQSIGEKLSLVDKYNIRGVGNWSIGQENPTVWNSYATSLPTTVPVSVTPEQEIPETVDQVDPNYTTYTVVAGDNLWLIANRHDTTISAIKEASGITSDQLSIGQKLLIPKQVEDTPVPPEDTTDDQTEPDTTDPDPKEEEDLTEGSDLMEDEVVTENEQPAEPEQESAPEPNPEPAPTTYTVKSGDSLSVIAQQFDTTVDKIQQQNNLTTTTIYIGQTLTIPTEDAQEAVSEVPEPEPEMTTTTYTVKSGDSLSVIAQRYNTTVDEIKQQNNLTRDTIYIGQTLTIPVEAEQAEPEPQESVVYTVKSGDSLSVIAQRYNTTVDVIKQQNNLTNDTIYIGQTLTIR